MHVSTLFYYTWAKTICQWTNQSLNFNWLTQIKLVRISRWQSRKFVLICCCWHGHAGHSKMRRGPSLARGPGFTGRCCTWRLPNQRSPPADRTVQPSDAAFCRVPFLRFSSPRSPVAKPRCTAPPADCNGGRRNLSISISVVMSPHNVTRKASRSSTSVCPYMLDKRLVTMQWWKQNALKS